MSRKIDNDNLNMSRKIGYNQVILSMSRNIDYNWLTLVCQAKYPTPG